MQNWDSYPFPKQCLVHSTYFSLPLEPFLLLLDSCIIDLNEHVFVKVHFLNNKEDERCSKPKARLADRYIRLPYRSQKDSKILMPKNGTQRPKKVLLLDEQLSTLISSPSFFLHILHSTLFPFAVSVLSFKLAFRIPPPVYSIFLSMDKAAFELKLAIWTPQTMLSVSTMLQKLLDTLMTALTPPKHISLHRRSFFIITECFLVSQFTFGFCICIPSPIM